MKGIQDLIDPRQVDMFDAFDRLSTLDCASDIKHPQLIVLGGQSCGKSSVLEAIGRFHFPVSDGLCTRFPTKLILRRASIERMDLSIDPGPSRSEADRKRLQQFKASLSDANDFSKRMKEVAEILGVSSPNPPPSASGSTPEPTSENHLSEFTDDVLVVHKYGPELPLANLVDLPGVFMNTSQEQSRESRQTVQKMAEDYTRSETNMILLVVGARMPFVSQAGVKIIEDMLVQDPYLLDRVVGVITSPDRSSSPAEDQKLLTGTLASFKLRHKWHAVKNQDQNERKHESLEERDEKEEKFFQGSDWKDVPEGQKGIKALKATLKEMFWAHTQAGLPSLVSRVQAKITETRLLIGKRSTGDARRKYLHDVARKFENLTKEACQGTYRDEDCTELHGFDEDCNPACKPFFGVFGDNCMDRNLRANLRSLSKTFASTMIEFGKTEKITRPRKNKKPEPLAEQTDAVPGQTNDIDQATALGHVDEVPAQKHPAQAIIKKHYTHDRPKSTDEKTFELWVATQIPVWRGSEPQGEPSEVSYSGLMGYQSTKWQKIALQHLRAVWEAVEKFIDLALTTACFNDKEMLQRLQKLLVTPKLKVLKEKSRRTMKKLLSCHGRSKTGFYDGLVHSRPVRWHAEELAQRLANLKTKAGIAQDPKDHTDIADELFKLAGDMISDIVSNPIVGFASDVVLRKAGLQSEDSDAESDYVSTTTGQKTVFGLIPAEMENISAARVIEYVETYYEITMMAFVGYFNSLVVENGILEELPKALLTQSDILVEKATLIDEVVGWREEDAKRLRDLQTLETVLATLEKYL
ncbi:Dynamin-2 [Arthrobotrys entomopaga]|nr:Dynamin-2 [Arthrobotrys entomopaga]